MSRSSAREIRQGDDVGAWPEGPLLSGGGCLRSGGLWGSGLTYEPADAVCCLVNDESVGSPGAVALTGRAVDGDAC